MIDFLGRKYLLLAVSFVCITAGIAGYFFNGGLKYHIDFAGGTEVRLSFEHTQDVARVREAVKDVGFSDAVIQSLGEGNHRFLVTIRESKPGIDQDLVNGISRHLNTKVATEGVELVGAGAGQEVRTNALTSILLTMLVLLVLIAILMSFSYGVGAIVALAHDLLMIFSFLVLSQIPVSLHVLAAVLALLGYSLNDTIVIFNRIRDNAALPAHKHHSAYEIVKISLNEVFRRTLLTSFSTFLALIPLIFLGGDSVRHFAMTMAVAVIVGTYSSIYIASPIVLAVNNNRL